MSVPDSKRPAFDAMMADGGPTLCLYHHPCNDGFTSAYFVKQQFPHCQLQPYRHGTELTEFIVRGENILIVDLCLQDVNLHVVRKFAKHWFIIDHHNTALPLVDDPNCWIDQSRSGAYLTWVALHGEENISKLAYHVDDYDRYVLADQDTEALAAAMKKLFDKNMNDWKILDNQLDMAIHQGRTLLRAAEKERRQVDGGQKVVYESFLGYDNIPVINCDLDGLVINALGHELGKTHPFVVFWNVGTPREEIPDGNILYSLRSDDANPNWVDVSAVAKQMGGGGHKQAAGFRSFFAPWDISVSVRSQLDTVSE